MPVVLFAGADLLDVVRAGARRAGRGAKGVRLTDPDVAVLLNATAQGAELAVAVLPAPRLLAALNLVAELGGRGLPVLGLHAGPRGPLISDASLGLLSNPELRDLDVAVPSIADEGERHDLWGQLRSAALEARHQLVEVDGSPALEEIAARGARPPADRWRALAAGAAGVLAGRLAAGNRRWRDPMGS